MTLYPIPNVPDSLTREIYANLLRSLPPPHDDTQEARDARDARAMATVAALIPENAVEAELAVTAVATDFHAKHALACTSQPGLAIDALKNHRAMAASMARQSQATIRTLRQLQIDRRKLEGAQNPAAMERSGYYFKDVSVLAPPPPPIPPEPPQPRKRVFEDMDDAEQYAARYPNRTVVIRAHGGVPPNCDFIPPEPELVDAIVASTSPMLQELDPPPDSPTLHPVNSNCVSPNELLGRL